MRKALLAAMIVALGCSSADNTTQTQTKAEPKTSPVELIGAGASFPYPLYSKWISEFNKVEPSTRVSYQSIGSGGGIRQFTERTVDFGASDAPMTQEALSKIRGAVLQIPTTVGAVVIAFNLPGIDALKLTPELVSALFRGEVKQWNDPKLVALNPALKSVSLAISPVYRSDGSGTTSVFTDYLSKSAAMWREQVGQGLTVKFPVGFGAKGNEGVAGQIKTMPGAVGYVEFAYAKQTGLAFALLKNRAGQFVGPTLEAMSAAAELPSDAPLTSSIVDRESAAAYPITSFTYILLSQDQADSKKGAAILRFLSWAVQSGQQFGGPLYYAPLPDSVASRVKTMLGSVTYGGKPIAL